MKNGNCPKCQNETVYYSMTGITFASNSAIYVNNLKELMVIPTKDFTNYVCTSCGYTETYIEASDKLEKISKFWKKA